MISTEWQYLPKQRYRTPSRSRSRSRSVTPPHWKQAQKRTIKFSDLERYEEEKRIRDQEIKRRESERKKRHEEMARDSKKSFFELNQGDVPPAKADNPEPKRTIEHEPEDGEIEIAVTAVKKLKTSSDVAKSLVTKNEIDMNALDYEIDRDENADETNVTHKNDIVAQALGVEIRVEKSVDPHATKSKASDRLEKKEHASKVSERKRHSKSLDREQKSRRKRSRTRSRSRSRSRDRRGRNARGNREIDRRRNNYSPPRRNNDRRRNDYRTQRDRRRSRSGSHHDKYRRNRRHSR